MTFKNDSSQAERKAFVKDTFHSRTHDESGGRWQKQTPTNVIGSSPVSYPKLPASSPWSCDPVPPEEPLGIDVSESPIVGEHHEVEASLDRDFGLKRSLRDGVPSATGVMPRLSKPTLDSEVERAPSADHARQPLTLSGRHSVRGVWVSPSNPIKRRLV